uniref:Uncharacterized protein n=1 Tax=Triticum urartu TaxID=4572 RepID=A0A8R7PTT8_TRIUA
GGVLYIFARFNLRLFITTRSYVDWSSELVMWYGRQYVVLTFSRAYVEYVGCTNEYHGTTYL